MRVLLQRVLRAKVEVDGVVTGEIERGIMLLVGFGRDDSSNVLKPMANKLYSMRLFEEGDKGFHVSVADIGGGVLLVPQFTLYADTSRGRRPGFDQAMEPTKAAKLFDEFIEEFKKTGARSIQTGIFGAHMQVELVNDGPVTLMVEL